MTSSETVQFVLCRIGDQAIAFNVFDVERVLPYERVTPLPGAPEFLEGMLPYGEVTIPVIDLRKRFETRAVNRRETRTVVVLWEEGRIGLVVDTVSGLVKVPVDTVTPPTKMVQGLVADYLQGIVRHGEETMLVLAVSAILNASERIALDNFSIEEAHG